MRFAFTENFITAISHGWIVATPATFNINITRSGIRLQELRKMNALLIGTSLATLLLAMPASSQVDLATATIDLDALTQDVNRVTKLINCCLDESVCGEEELSAKG
jgi:hypothetical protein